LSTSRQITCLQGTTTYTAIINVQYLLTTTVATAGAGSIGANPASPDGFYNSGASVQLTASADFVSWSGHLSGSANPQSLIMNGPKSVTANFASTPPTGTAVFLKTDSSTAGSWRGVYGAEGYNVVNDSDSYPAYLTVTPAGNSSWIWDSSDSDPRALQKASSPIDRIAACWFSGSSFTIDIAFNQ
jgi:hypothetical protein